MNVRGAHVDWGEGIVNDPRLVVEVDELPSAADFIYTQKDSAYFAEHPSGVCSFYYHTGAPEKQQGFGGAAIDIKLTDGSDKTLYGPWSSNSQSMRELGFTPCMEVTFAIQGDTLRLAGSITIELANKILEEHCPDVELYLTRELGFYVPKQKDQPPKNL